MQFTWPPMPRHTANRAAAWPARQPSQQAQQPALQCTYSCLPQSSPFSAVVHSGVQPCPDSRLVDKSVLLQPLDSAA